MIAFLSFLRGPWAKVLAGVALVIALAGAGYWFSHVLADRQALQVKVSSLEAQNRSLRDLKAQADAALREAVKSQQQARREASEALEKLNDANDKASSDWKHSRIPPGIRESLK